MKVCPCCGYKDSPTARQCFRQIQVEFGDLPVLEMMKRKWIAGDLRTPIPVIKDELRRFFGLGESDDLGAFLNAPKRMPCQILDDIGRLIHAPEVKPTPQVASKPQPKKRQAPRLLDSHGLKLVG